MSPAAILQLHPDTKISRNPETLQSRRRRGTRKQASWCHKTFRILDSSGKKNLILVNMSPYLRAFLWLQDEQVRVDEST
jgi:hypothetical protein